METNDLKLVIYVIDKCFEIIAMLGAICVIKSEGVKILVKQLEEPGFPATDHTTLMELG